MLYATKKLYHMAFAAIALLFGIACASPASAQQSMKVAPAVATFLGRERVVTDKQTFLTLTDAPAQIQRQFGVEPGPIFVLYTGSHEYAVVDADTYDRALLGKKVSADWKTIIS